MTRQIELTYEQAYNLLVEIQGVSDQSGNVVYRGFMSHKLPFQVKKDLQQIIQTLIPVVTEVENMKKTTEDQNTVKNFLLETVKIDVPELDLQKISLEAEEIYMLIMSKLF